MDIFNNPLDIRIFQFIQKKNLLKFKKPERAEASLSKFRNREIKCCGERLRKSNHKSFIKKYELQNDFDLLSFFDIISALFVVPYKPLLLLTNVLPIRHRSCRNFPANTHKVPLKFVYQKGHSVINDIFILASAGLQFYLAE